MRWAWGVARAAREAPGRRLARTVSPWTTPRQAAGFSAQYNTFRWTTRDSATFYYWEFFMQLATCTREHLSNTKSKSVKVKTLLRTDTSILHAWWVWWVRTPRTVIHMPHADFRIQMTCMVIGISATTQGRYCMAICGRNGLKP